MDNIKLIEPNIAKLKSNTPGFKIGNQFFVGGIGGDFIPGQGGQEVYYQCTSVTPDPVVDVSGAGLSAVNGSYTMQDTTKEGTARVWQLTGTSYIIYYSSNLQCWCLGIPDAAYSYKQTTQQVDSPWDSDWQAGASVSTPAPTVAKGQSLTGTWSGYLTVVDFKGVTILSSLDQNLTYSSGKLQVGGIYNQDGSRRIYDKNLLAKNIAKGKSIFGVAGEFQGYDYYKCTSIETGPGDNLVVSGIQRAEGSYDISAIANGVYPKIAQDRWQKIVTSGEWEYHCQIYLFGYQQFESGWRYDLQISRYSIDDPIASESVFQVFQAINQGLQQRTPWLGTWQTYVGAGTVTSPRQLVPTTWTGSILQIDQKGITYGSSVSQLEFGAVIPQQGQIFNDGCTRQLTQSDLTPQNIRSGINILGVQGSLVQNVSLSDTTATADTVLAGYVFLDVNGTATTGTYQPPVYYKCSGYTTQQYVDCAGRRYYRSSASQRYQQKSYAAFVHQTGDVIYTQSTSPAVGDMTYLWDAQNSTMAQNSQITDTGTDESASKTWSGYQCTVNAQTGAWQFSQVQTAGLLYNRILPQISSVYDKDCTYKCTEFYTGV